MKNRKILIGIVALTVALAAAIGFYVSQPKLNETAELDSTAASRDQSEEGDILLRECSDSFLT